MAEQLQPNKGRNQSYSNYQSRLQNSSIMLNQCADYPNFLSNNNTSSTKNNANANYQPLRQIQNIGKYNQQTERSGLKNQLQEKHGPPCSTIYPKQRYTPYQSRHSQSVRSSSYAQAASFNSSQYYNNLASSTIDLSKLSSGSDYNLFPSSNNRFNTSTNSSLNSSSSTTSSAGSSDDNQAVILMIGNLDWSHDESTLRYNLLQQLKPITPVISMQVEGNSVRVKVPSKQFAKLVVAYLHRKKFGHKRMVVSYARDASSTESATLRCQVAGLLKDVPFYSLPMNTFRELFQSRFKTAINVIDLFRMQDICNITCADDKDKIISLHSDLINSIRNNNPLVECLQMSVPYCTLHFKKEQHKGWAEQDIEPLPNVVMTVKELREILYAVLNIHKGDIPILSIMHCIEGEMKIRIPSNENGVNLEHLISCVNGVQITNNQFGIKVLTWSTNDTTQCKDNLDEPLYHISHEIIELIKLSSKSTLKFNKFIPAYHNHFGKQCRVADYGYTKLIDLFEALSSVVQVIGDGENRLLTLTHRTQLKRFTNDLVRIIKTQSNRSILLSQLAIVFSQAQNRIFDVTDYGVCDITDILDGLVHNNTVITTVVNNRDILISIPKRKQTSSEMDKTSTFAEEVIELLRNAPQYSILFQKFVRSYHYHFGYQCRLSDFGFMKLTDLMDAINGIVELEASSEEHRKIYLSPKVAQRIFSEQLYELAQATSNKNKHKIKLREILNLHKNRYGYQIQPNMLGFRAMIDAIRSLPFIEFLEMENEVWLIFHHDDPAFRTHCYAACTAVIRGGKHFIPFSEFYGCYMGKSSEEYVRKTIGAMNVFFEIKFCQLTKQEIIKITPLMKFLIQAINVLNGNLKSNLKSNLNSLKCSLDIHVTTCFAYGYPNLKSLLHQFPDIFVITENAAGSGNFDITLSTECYLVQWLKTLPNERFTFVDDVILGNCENLCQVSGRMFSSQVVGVSKNKPVYQLPNIKKDLNLKQEYSNYENADLFYNDLSLPSSSSGITNNPMLLSSMESSYPTAVQTEQSEQPSDSNEPYITANLSTTDTNGILNKTYCNPLDYVRLLSTFYEPPKPDNPASKDIPFWIDPIWSNHTPWSFEAEDNLEIPLPILPLSSPWKD